MSRSSSLGSISTRQRRIAQLTGEDADRSLTNLNHYIDEHWLREAYSLTRKDGSLGVDGQSSEEYAEDLEGNLRDLLGRFKSGSYRAPPVRRAWIPKGSGQGRRPIGIPTFEDKVLQRAVQMVLEPIYEQDFLDCSYGFRRGRSPHQALEALSGALVQMGGGWVLEVDIENFFEELDFHHLRTFLEHRVRDGVIRRSIDKWLKAGVMENGKRWDREKGTPQGGVISPMLANIYLHYVLDRWFEEVARPRLRRGAFLARFADDVVFAFAEKRDAERVLRALRKRLERYGLKLHSEKTRLVYFRKPRYGDKPDRGRRPGSFDFLGFRHYWGRSRKGRWVPKRKTAPDRMVRALKRISWWCRRWRHGRVRWQHAQLSLKLLGHYAYYGITHNKRALERFRYQVERIWHKWLATRSQRGMPWERYSRLLKRYPLPKSRIVHQYGVT